MSFLLVVLEYGALRLRITEVFAVVSVFRIPYSVIRIPRPHSPDSHLLTATPAITPRT
ncbi:hypothetical protein ONE56_01050 [Vibrio mytili]|uniref:hypothetical protein n=1 Tax=Vibrio mytili TaxID=50718 RepID=UPI003C6F7B4F